MQLRVLEICRRAEEDDLRVRVFSSFGKSRRVLVRVHEALKQVPMVRRSIEEDALILDPILGCEGSGLNRGMSKRKIRDLRF